MTRHRIALVGLGMAVTPHAKSLLDLADRVEVAWAMSPSAARRDSFAARFPFPAADNLGAILADRSISAVAVLLRPTRTWRSRANWQRPASTSCSRNRSRSRLRAPSSWLRPARRWRYARCRAAAPLQAGGGATGRHPAGRGRWARSSTARRASAYGGRRATTMSRPRHASARRGRAADAGHSPST